MADESDKRAPVAGDDVATHHAPLSSSPNSERMRAAPQPGTRIARYIVEGTIGVGGMGIVVAARHEQLGEVVAIKLLHPRAMKDDVQVERFVREARAIVRIKSDHVVRVLDVGTDEASALPYIVMEYLPGRDVGQILAQHGAMPVQMAVDYIIQICEAVAAAHMLGIIHRDLKPSNFFVTQRPDGSPLVKVLDFGISKAAQQDGAPDSRLTETTAVFGSPMYMSPEQIRSSKNVDPRSDVWSLGVALFEMITGKLPFMADNVPGLLASVVADPPFRVRSFVGGVPEDLEMIVLSCLEKDPALRIASAAELAARLGPFASPEGAHLADRIDRIARGIMTASQSFPPGSSSGRLVPLPPLSRPSAFPPALGSTGTDLSASRPLPAASRPSNARSVAMIVSALAVIASAGAVVAYLWSRDRDRNADRANATAMPAASPPPAPTTLAPSAAPAESSEPAAVASGPRLPRARPAAGGPRSRGAAALPASAATAAVPPAPPPPPPARPAQPDLGLDRRN